MDWNNVMKGNCLHIINVVKPNDGMTPELEITAPTVQMFNDNDQFYHQIFETETELEAFIEQLRTAGREAFSNAKSPQPG